jgi:hypothetical protein
MTESDTSLLGSKRPLERTRIEDDMGYLTEWHGKAIVDWEPKAGAILNGSTGYRVSYEWENGSDWLDCFAKFLESPHIESVTMLIVGNWLPDNDNKINDVLQSVVAARDRLPNLTAIFMGDLSSMDSEISWIVQTDMSPLFLAYPKLEHFGTRGSGTGLSFGSLKHDCLKSLTIETGGLQMSVLDEVIQADLPNLTHLELYFGTVNYGSQITLESVQPFLQRGHEIFPNLTYLGLRNCEFVDDLAVSITQNGGRPVLQNIEVLDLSLGTLGDIGVEELASCVSIQKLKKLDIHYHFASEASIAKLQTLEIEVDTSDMQNPLAYSDVDTRFVAVSE